MAQRTNDRSAGLQASLMEMHGDQIRRKTLDVIKADKQAVIDRILKTSSQTIEDWVNLQVWLGEKPDLLPAEQRRIHCSITGQPIGELSHDIIAMYQKAREADCPEKMLGQIALTTQPAPHWVDRSPLNLKRNMRLDPWGFLVYMTERFMCRGWRRLGKLSTQGNWYWNSPEAYANWHNSKIVCYRRLKAECDVELIHKLNVLLLRFDGYIGLTSQFWPFGHPVHIASNDAIEAGIELLTLTINEFFTHRRRFRTKYNLRPHRIHELTAAAEIGKPGEAESVIGEALRANMRNRFESLASVVETLEADDDDLAEEQSKRESHHEAVVVTDLKDLVGLEVKATIHQSGKRAPRAEITAIRDPDNPAAPVAMPNSLAKWILK